MSAAILAVSLDIMLQRELRSHIDKSLFGRTVPKSCSTLQMKMNASIDAGSSPSQRKYVESKPNQADDVLRDLEGRDLVGKKRWLQGPELLWTGEEFWPIRLSE